MSARLDLAESELADIRAAFRPLLAEKDRQIAMLTELLQRERERGDRERERAEAAIARLEERGRVLSMKR